MKNKKKKKEWDGTDTLIIMLCGLLCLGIIVSAIFVYDMSSENKSENTTAISSVGYQTIKMNVTANGWQPDTFTLRKGVPVKWIIDGQQLTGCNSVIKVPAYNLRFNVNPGLQTIEFTPAESGTIPWSCDMGMIKGTFVVR
jgi:uncharacterized protein